VRLGVGSKMEKKWGNISKPEIREGCEKIQGRGALE